MTPVQHLLTSNRVLSATLLFVVATVAVSLGVVTALNPVIVISIITVVFIWILLVRQFELALALLTVGFFVYPLVADIVGIGTSSTVTLAFYGSLSTAALVGAALSERDRLPYVFGKPVTILVILFVGWMLFSWFMMSRTNDFALKKLGYSLFLMLLPLLIGQILNKESIHKFFGFSVTISLLGVMLLFRNVLAAGFDAPFRPSASEGASALGFAYSVAFSAVMGLGLLNAVKMRRWQQLAVFLLAASGLFSAIATGSRGPLMALITSIIILIYRARGQTRLYSVLGILAGLIGVWLLQPILPSIVVARYASLVGASNVQDISQIFAASRGDIWIISLKAWLSSPITGIGLGNFLVFGQGMASFTHNFLLEVLTELGIIGILLLIALLFHIGRLSINILKHSNPLHVSMVALLIFSIVKMSFSGQIQVSVEFWVVCGLIAGVSQKEGSLTTEKIH